MDKQKGRISIVMLPFLAHGHISPFFELAKHLSKRNCNIFLCSTPINLSSIKNRVSDKDSSASIKLVELHLPSSPDLPPHYHTTNGLPSHLMVPLRNAFETAGPTFSEILKTLNPDLLIYDFNPSWAPEIASSHNIPAVCFIIGGAASSSMIVSKTQVKKYPFLDFDDNSNITPEPPSADNMKLFLDFMTCFERSCDIILIKSFRELEGKSPAIYHPTVRYGSHQLQSFRRTRPNPRSSNLPLLIIRPSDMVQFCTLPPSWTPSMSLSPQFPTGRPWQPKSMSPPPSTAPRICSSKRCSGRKMSLKSLIERDGESLDMDLEQPDLDLDMVYLIWFLQLNSVLKGRENF